MISKMVLNVGMRNDSTKMQTKKQCPFTSNIQLAVISVCSAQRAQCKTKTHVSFHGLN